MRRHGGKRSAIRSARSGIVLLATVPAPVLAATTDTNIVPGIGLGEIVIFAVVVGVVSFAVFSAIALMRARDRAETENAEFRLRVSDLKANADRAEALIEGEDHRLVAWGRPGEPPLVAGHLSEESGVPTDRQRFLAFGTWLQPESAARLERAIATLRERGE